MMTNLRLQNYCIFLSAVVAAVLILSLAIGASNLEFAPDGFIAFVVFSIVLNCALNEAKLHAFNRFLSVLNITLGFVALALAGSLPAVAQIRGNIPAQLLLTLALVGLALAIKESKYTAKNKSSAINACSVILFSIGIISVYSVWKDFSFTAAWFGFLEVNLWHSIVILTLAAYLFVVSMRYIRTEVRKLESGWNLVLTHSTLNILLISVIVTLISHLPYWNKLQQYEGLRYQKVSEQNFLKFNQFILTTITSIQAHKFSAEFLSKINDGNAILINDPNNLEAAQIINYDIDKELLCQKINNYDIPFRVVSVSDKPSIVFCTGSLSTLNQQRIVLLGIADINRYVEFDSKYSNIYLIADRTYLLKASSEAGPTDSQVIQYITDYAAQYNNSEEIYQIIRDEKNYKFTIKSFQTYRDIRPYYFLTISASNRLIRDLLFVVIEFALLGLTIAVALSMINYLFFSKLSDAANELNRKFTEQRTQIKTTLAQKDNLLRELHHRVKNNMQIISSLLRMQSRELVSESPKLAKVVETCNSRIQSMALLHEHLYQSTNFERVVLKSYLGFLTNEIFRGMTMNTQVELKITGEEVEVEIEKAIICGIISNEIITNSVKYAFDGIDQPAFSVDISAKLGYISVIYQDNGVGIGNAANSISGTSLGSKLIYRLASQLDGRTKLLKKEAGTGYRLIFKA